MATEFARMAQIIGSTSDWGSNDLVLESGEIGLEILGTGLIKGKIGDGVTVYSLLDYTLGEGVTLDTDQTITGLKTINNQLRFLNLQDQTSLAHIQYVNYPVRPLFNFDSLEPNSNVFLTGRNVAGDPFGLWIGAEDQTLNFGTHLIADYGGVAGRTWGSVEANGSSVQGDRFSSVRNSIGFYSITFDDAAVNSEQSCCCTIRGETNLGKNIAVSHISATQIDVHISDIANALADSLFEFSRHYATEPFTPPPTAVVNGL
jgi:hypothetical protein